MGDPTSEDETQVLVVGDRPPPSSTFNDRRRDCLDILNQPFQWLRMLCKELNPSFVVGVVLVYGLGQGFAGSFFRVVSDYYWKDVQKLQPSAVQMFMGFYYIPWIMKPIWGLLTDVFPMYGYRRRPYFIISGAVGTVAALVLATHAGLTVAAALVCMVGITGAMAVADVTIDACVAANSVEKPALAADMQSLCMFSSSAGALAGYSSSGLLVRLLGAQVRRASHARYLPLVHIGSLINLVIAGCAGVIALAASVWIGLGFLIYEARPVRYREKAKVMEKVGGALKGMARTIKRGRVWKPSLYIYLSLALSISTHEGQFYWYTDPKAGPAFSQEFVGMIYAIGALASIAGVLIYHKLLKDYPFRTLLFSAQLVYGLSGMLDLVFVLRWNLRLGLPDSFFVVFEQCTSHIVSKIRWMPMMVLSAKLCPPGIEGMFFALLMCIDSLGGLSAKFGGGLALHWFHVTRTDFRNLWLVVFVRNLLRIATLGLVFLVPMSDPSDVLLPSDLLVKAEKEYSKDEEGLQLTQTKGREAVYV
ncbi:putative folate-biopterin transporter 6 [Acorus calamus]|uniref:Folate-biopterin transporter 6 n=1 Tax=Acorus calamus TaxID=4465 RepID=A0AAV9CK15_ACOCL|nr:putative folate-biopterin transporter 6 [Acorus calamus]